MAKYVIENEKYIIRQIEEKDKEQESDEEGELAIRTMCEADMGDIMKIFEDVFEKIGHGTEKSITIQYTFD